MLSVLATNLLDVLHTIDLHTIDLLKAPQTCSTIPGWLYAYIDADKDFLLHTSQATEALKITSKALVNFGVMDGIIPEPSGGAHADPMAAFPAIKTAITDLWAE